MSGPVMRRVHRERVLLVGGGRALIMQLAHPKVAAGVAQHSEFPTGALERLRRTMDLSLALVYGTDEEAERAASRIRTVHERVSGTAGDEPYSAEDPALLLWVHATLIESTLVVYERYVRPIPPDAQVRYYEETKESARMLGIPDEVLPPDLHAFRGYVGGMLAGPELAAIPESRRLVRGVLRPPLPLPLRPASETVRLMTLSLLPERIRDLFDLRAGRVTRAAEAAASRGSRVLLPLLPARVRTFSAGR